MRLEKKGKFSSHGLVGLWTGTPHLTDLSRTNRREACMRRLRHLSSCPWLLLADHCYCYSLSVAFRSASSVSAVIFLRLFIGLSFLHWVASDVTGAAVDTFESGRCGLLRATQVYTQRTPMASCGHSSSSSSHGQLLPDAGGGI